MNHEKCSLFICTITLITLSCSTRFPSQCDHVKTSSPIQLSFQLVLLALVGYTSNCYFDHVDDELIKTMIFMMQCTGFYKKGPFYKFNLLQQG